VAAYFSDKKGPKLMQAARAFLIFFVWRRSREHALNQALHVLRVSFTRYF